MKQKLLVVDDIPAVKEFILDALQPEYDVKGVSSAKDALEELNKHAYQMVLTDIAMPEMSGEELTRRIRENHPEVPVIAITAYGSVENATKLMQLGALDYIEKPFTIKRLKHTINKVFEFSELQSENRVLQQRIGEQEVIKGMVGNSVKLQHVREKIRLVAKTDATILVTGESGAGKEIAAREIHRMGDRANKSFVRVNCASVPSALLENELFGREKGKFSGGERIETGKFEAANNGTIVLDEVGELEHTIQTKLLRVIQEGEFNRVGGQTPVRVDVKIIATTSMNLLDEIEKGRFREDLFYRLNVVPLEIPPLRERREDIPLLINHFIEMFSRKNETAPITLTKTAVDKLCNGYWKGNVRQLQNVIERAVILRNGMTLDADYFQFENEREEQMSRVEHTFQFGTVREMEKLMILNRLRDNKNNRTRSAETLDISVRTLRNKLNEYNVPNKYQKGAAERLASLSD